MRGRARVRYVMHASETLERSGSDTREIYIVGCRRLSGVKGRGDIRNRRLVVDAVLLEVNLPKEA